MGLFRKRRFLWYEPWFFQQRIRTPGAWIAFGVFLLVIVGLVAAAIAWTAQPANPPSWWELVVLPLGFAAAVWWLLDGTEARRSAVLDDKQIVVGGDMGKYSHPTFYEISKIDGAAIVMPEESKWPAPALFFLYNGEEQAIGIESKVSFRRLAQAIHDVGIPVRLDGWHPDEDSGFEKAFQWQATEESRQAVATITQLAANEPGLVSPAGVIKAIVLQCWALLLWLALTIAVGYYAYLNWNNLGFAQAIVVFGLPILILMAAGQYTDRYATAATSYALIDCAKNQIAARSQPVVDPRSEDLIPVEVFRRDQFDKTIQKMHEMGFIQADENRRRIVFEGKKEQWIVPAESIVSLTMEEVQAGTAGQAALGGLNYYVVVTFLTKEGRQEFGLRHSEREYGEVTDVKRAAGGIKTFEAIETVLPLETPERPPETDGPGMPQPVA